MSNKNITIKEMIKNIDYRLTHLEDMETDSRHLMLKLVKQGNTIVKFLEQFDVEELDPAEFEIGLPDLSEISNQKELQKDKINKTEALKELVDNIIERHADLKEFEEELEKYKNDITPGQVGES